jgi:hypothetical protein
MAVIINDFEIVIEPPAEEKAPPRQASAQREARLALAPGDVQEVVRQFVGRSLRVYAH